MSYTRAVDELAARLRALHEQTGLSGVRFARRLGWAQSKVSRIANGRQHPTEQDVREWAHAAGASADTLAALLAILERAQDEYASWRRQLRRGEVASKQDQVAELEQASRVRVFEAVVINGLLQTVEYARHILTAAYLAGGVDTTPDDIADAARRRIRRQGILYDPGRVHIIMGEAALYYRTCPPEVMRGQLDRLLALLDLDTARIGLIPFDTTLPVVPSHVFAMYDDDQVVVEIYSAELTLRTARDVELYARIWEILDAAAVYGEAAKAIVRRALAALAEV
jgi:transcriptional regulator with XRE-family HTH domain